jgi:hypothetical protein
MGYQPDEDLLLRFYLDYLNKSAGRDTQNISASGEMNSCQSANIDSQMGSRMPMGE